MIIRDIGFGVQHKIVKNCALQIRNDTFYFPIFFVDTRSWLHIFAVVICSYGRRH